MANNWWELQIICDPDLEDSIFWQLEKFGCKGMASEKKGNSYLVRAYLPENQAELPDLQALLLSLRQDALTIGLPVPTLEWQVIDEEDWASSWKEHWQPQEIGDRFLINPAWLPLPKNSDRLVLLLDPGMAFGTGNHATTQLCLESLEIQMSNNSTNVVLADIGCGSGILSIGAVLLGASKVYAVDTDPLAVQSTGSNSLLNGISPQRLVVEQGSVARLLQLTSAPVDGIMCNILAEVIIGLIPAMSAIAKPTTWGILSGILVNQAGSVTDALAQHGWLVATLQQQKDWCCLNIRRY